MFTLPKTKLEVRTGAILGGFWAGLFFLVFILPLLFSDSVTMTSNIGLVGDERTKTAPGLTFALPLTLFPLFVGAIGFVIGVGLRQNRQLILLGAANPMAPEHLRKPLKSRFWDKYIFRLNAEGTDRLPRARK